MCVCGGGGGGDGGGLDFTTREVRGEEGIGEVEEPPSPAKLS